MTTSAPAQLDPSAPRAKPLNARQHGRWHRPDPAASPKHRKSVPSPRTSPSRAPREIEVPQAAVDELRRVYGPGSERMYERTRIAAVHARLPIGAHLGRALSVLYAACNDAGRSLWLSYRACVVPFRRTLRTVVEHFAELEALGLITITPRFVPRFGNLANDIQLTLPPALRAMLEALRGERAAAAPEQLVDDGAGDPAAEAPAELVDDAPAEQLVDEGDASEAEEIAAAREELLARAAPAWQPTPPRVATPPPTAPLVLPAAQLAPVRRPVAETPAAAPHRPTAAMLPPVDASRLPGVLEGALLELLEQHLDVFVEVELRDLAARLAKMIRRGGAGLAHALLGIEHAALKSPTGPRSNFIVSCVQVVAAGGAVGELPKPVRAILRRAERGETAATWAGTGPPN